MTRSRFHSYFAAGLFLLPLQRLGFGSFPLPGKHTPNRQDGVGGWTKQSPAADGGEALASWLILFGERPLNSQVSVFLGWSINHIPHHFRFDFVNAG